ncbi:hypothetical protein PPYR_02069 [Photinus pyralis]|uniref:MULE transposase domain-containing protein n=1 Tax=Photinus pyralis TaxID=7054 RepID=A0A5N4B671_PHOPY|nr:hypothetical protein PPYR_02069 [Photinus pyralis]
MNMGQLEILEKFADDCICLDGTHGLNPYDFQLHTLLVLDDLREGFPCAFLFSNRSDVEILVLFFSCIKEKMKRQIKPRVFMSDMEKTFYNAWIRVMKPADFRIYCTWHVDRSWRKNLNKIHSKEKQVMVYKQLRTILQELDQNAFTQMIDNFLRALVNDADTCEFGQYFKRYYTENVEAWAYCHRLHSGLNTNMHIERMHETIKYIYLNGKVVKRLDKAINALMKFVRDKLFERLITLNKGKISSKLKDLRARHKTSEGMDLKLVMVTEEGWEVPSALCQDLYKVEARKINCTCKLVCQQCHACIHQYSCSCIDSSVKWNMCKHVHLVCRFLNDRKELEVGNITQGPVPNASILQIDDGISSKVEEEQKILAAISQNTSISEENLYDEKEKLKMEVMELIHDIDKISTREEISALKKLVGPIKPTLHAIRLQQSRDLQHSMGASSKVHHNKNIKQQRRLFKTKKKTKKETVGLSNPGTEEINQIAINLCNENFNLQLESDYEELYPDSSMKMYSELPQFSEKVLSYARKQKDKDIQQRIKEIDEEESADVKNLKCLFLLPFLLGMRTIKRKKGQKCWRPSKIEVSEGFVIHLKVIHFFNLRTEQKKLKKRIKYDIQQWTHNLARGRVDLGIE